jgi:adenosylhomocysteine nucleosidase
MPKVAIVAALEREVSGLTKRWTRVHREHEGRSFDFFERDELVVVCGGIGMEAARRAAEAVIALYCPTLVQSVGFAGALDSSLLIGDVFAPAVVIDARDGSRVEIEGGDRKGTLVSFMAVAGIDQKANLAQAYGARAVDMEASAVAEAARVHGIRFSAIKAISDAYDFEMPGTARFIDPQGRFRTAGFALFAALRPWLWPRIAQLAGNSRKAARSLGENLASFQQELRRASAQNSVKITAPPAPPHAEAATSASRAGGRK